jgi:hypothetical protein
MERLYNDASKEEDGEHPNLARWLFEWGWNPCNCVTWGNALSKTGCSQKTEDLLSFLVVWQKKSVYGGNFSLESVKGYWTMPYPKVRPVWTFLPSFWMSWLISSLLSISSLISSALKTVLPTTLIFWMGVSPINACKGSYPALEGVKPLYFSISRSDTTYGGEGALRCANTPYA